MRGLLGSLALAAAAVVAALAIAEIALRSLITQPDFSSYDRGAGWTLNPGTAGWQHQEGTAWLAINREGFRGPEVTERKPPGTVRIAVLGDSFTEAQQVALESTFCAVMQRKLGECLAPGAGPVQVLNFGVDGYGTTQELIALRRRVWRFDPDAVVLAFFTGNDLRNNSIVLEGDQCRPFFVARNGGIALGGPFVDSAWFRFQCMLRFESRHWRVIALLSHARVLIRDRLRARKARAHPAVQGHELGISATIYRAPAGEAWRDAWNVTEEQIALMHREVASHHVPFLAVTLTNAIQVYPDAAVRAAYMRHLGVSDLFYADRRLAALGQREGFPVLNLAEPMQRWADEHHTFLHGFRSTQVGTGHWNVAGHNLGGPLIAERLCSILGKNPPPSRVDTGGEPSATRENYRLYCARCHGAEGRGDGPAAATLRSRPGDFADCAAMRKFSDRMLAKVIRAGGPAAGLSSQMPPWRSIFSDRKIDNLVRLIGSFCASGERGK